MKKHTPVPWNQWKENPDFIEAGDKVICEVYNDSNYTSRRDGEIIPKLDEGKSNSDFIIKACNSHYEILDKLRIAERFIYTVTRGKKSVYGNQILKDISLTIAKVEAL